MKHGLHRRLPLLLALWVLWLSSTGCAVYYGDRDGASGRLWGVGTLKTKLEQRGDQAVAVRYLSAPGLCLELGRPGWGLNLGYLVEQQLWVMDANHLSPAADRPARAVSLWPNCPSAWKWGWQKAVVPTAGHPPLAAIAGRAYTGLNLGLGGSGHHFGSGHTTRQSTALLAANARLELYQRRLNWNGFDLYNAAVTDEPFLFAAQTRTFNHE